MRVFQWAAVGVFCAAFASSLQGGVVFQVIARTGEQAPGASAGVTISWLGRPDQDSPLIGSNRVVFRGTTSTGFTVFASDLAGVVAPLAVVGAQAPDMPLGELFTDLGFPLVGPDGRAMIAASTTTSAGYFAQDGSGALRLIAGYGDAAPGLPDGTLNVGFSPQHMAACGSTVGFYASISNGTSATAGIWKSTGPGSTAPVVIAGGATSAVATSATGITGAKINALSAGIFNRTVAMNSGGQVVYRARATASPNPSGIWGPAAGGGTMLLARQGAAAPGTTGVFADVSSPVSPSFHTLNEQGAVVFGALLTQYTGGISSANDSGIWVSDGSTVRKLLQEYTQAAGAPAGVLHGDVTSARPMINATGKIVVTTNLGGTGVTPTSDSALFGHDAADNFTMLLREGDFVPMIDGARFGNFEAYTAINRPGMIAFANNLQTGYGGVTAANDEAIFARSPDGVLNLILREGDAIEVAPGVFKTVATRLGYARAMSVMAGSHQDGYSSTLDDSGNLIILTTFSDNSTAVLKASVPEPTGLFPILAAMAMLAGRSRRLRP